MNEIIGAWVTLPQNGEPGMQIKRKGDPIAVRPFDHVNYSREDGSLDQDALTAAFLGMGYQLKHGWQHEPLSGREYAELEPVS